MQPDRCVMTKAEPQRMTILDSGGSGDNMQRGKDPRMDQI